MEIVGEMCLIEIAGGVGQMGEGVGRAIVVDDMTEADERREVFCGHADGPAKAFFESVLAYIELFCEALDG